MGLFKRVSDLLSANLNDLLDQCENPERMLRQAVREMEIALGRLMDGAARAIAHQCLLARQLNQHQQEVARRLKTAQAAVARGDDQMARRELQHKVEHQQLAEGLAQQMATAETLSQRLRHQVTSMRIKLAEARCRLSDLTARSRAAAARRKFISSMPNEACASTVVSDFQRLCARVEQSEAETEAWLELLGDPDTIEPLDAAIEAELQALKEKTNHATC